MKFRNLLTALTLVLLVGCSEAQNNEHNVAQTHNHKQEVFYETPVYEKEWMQPGIHPDRIMLNIGADPTTTASVTWRTTTEVKTAYAEIAKATAAPKFWRTAQRFTAKTTLLDGREVEDAGIMSNHHSVTFNTLEPNTLYGYRVGDGEHWSEWIQFKTASKTNDKFSFIYLGDAQNNIFELFSRAIRQGFQKAPDARFIVYAGDLVSPADSEEDWTEWFKAGGFIHSMIPSFPSPGNHDYHRVYEHEGNKGKYKQKLSIQWRQQFTLPENGPKGVDELKETSYYMDFQGVRMISLDTNKLLEEQAKWLREVLANNPNKWTIVTYHHPFYPISRGRADRTRRDLFKPIFDEFKVDLALQGHDHAYARGRTIDKTTGTMYVVSIGGGKMYRLSPEGWERWGAKQERDAENTQLVQVLTVDGDTLQYKSYTATGELYDAFDLVKNEKGPNTLVDRQSEAIDARYHHNTVNKYHDELPLDLKNIVMAKYKDAGYVNLQVDKIKRALDSEAGIYYGIEIRNKAKEKLKIKIDESGNIFEEKFEAKY
ncbi:MAG: metallophosphoesterase family protein [Colwellia sp.]|nr:metallophosphoesterase family protein [Colwellia sp.]